MWSGQVEANLTRLNEIFNVRYIPDLIALKLSRPEKSFLKETNLGFYRQKYKRLTLVVEQSMKNTSLPEYPTGRNAFTDRLVQMRMRYP
jgi:uncharacterized protein